MSARALDTEFGHSYIPTVDLRAVSVWTKTWTAIISHRENKTGGGFSLLQPQTQSELDTLPRVCLEFVKGVKGSEN